MSRHATFVCREQPDRGRFTIRCETEQSISIMCMRAPMSLQSYRFSLCWFVSVALSISLLYPSLVDKKKSDKSDAANSSAKQAAKKISTLDEQLKARNREMSMVQMKSTLFVGIILVGVYSLLNHLFDGQVVAKIPFEPFSLLRGMSHRGLPGSDPTDCSASFIYILCQLGVRANISKFLGFKPASTGPSIFQQPNTQ